jgi:AraC-like DNA-binding protein
MNILKIVEDSLQFTCHNCGIYKTKLNETIKNNPFLVIGKVENNGFKVNLKNGEKYKVLQNQGYCTPQNSNYQTLSFSGIAGTYHWSHISYNIFGGIPLTQYIKIPIIFSVETGNHIGNIVDQLVFISKENTESLLSIVKRQALGMELLGYLLESTNYDQAVLDMQFSKLNRLYEAIQYIQENVFNEIDVKKCAKMCNYSSSRFHQLFADATGFTPLKYHTHLKIKEAQTLLVSDKSIAEIANICGYEDQHYFSRIFKSHTGDTASEFRKKIKNKKIVA